MKRLAVVFVLLAACSPQEVVDQTIARTAEVVVSAVAGDGVARCVVDHAEPSELQVLARDVGVRAGTRTLAIIKGVLDRPDTQTCLTRAKLAMPVLQ